MEALRSIVATTMEAMRSIVATTLEALSKISQAMAALS
jgi:hypothetical protein